MADERLNENTVQTLLDALDAAGEKLREVLDAEDSVESPTIPYYMDGCAFLEMGYLMVDQLAQAFPTVFKTLHDHHYAPLLAAAERGQMSWGEALSGMPAFLGEYATDKVHQELFAADEE
jgi:hypothetical protein